MKTKTIWHGRPFPHNWEFYAECEEGENIQIAIKNEEGTKKIAPSPKEIVLQGMAACTGVDVVSTLQKMRQSLKTLLVECDATQTETTPKVFATCIMTYHVTGEELNAERVAHCVLLSFTKYCGVSAMIEKSGCHVTPKLIVNGKEIEIWDAQNNLSNKLQDWLKNVASKAPNGVALVTGGSRGIGAAIVKQLVIHGFAVIPTARHKVTAEDKNIFEAVYLDVTKSSSIVALKNFLEKNSVKLNLLIHNAGVAFVENDEHVEDALNLSLSELRYIYEVNVFGLIETNNALMGLMKEKSTVAMVSSTMGHTMRDTYTWSAYRLSKRTVIQYAKQVALQCSAENKSINILSLHPGSVITDMNPEGQITPEKSAKNIAELLSGNMNKAIKEKNGGFWLFEQDKNKWICLD